MRIKELDPTDTRLTRILLLQHNLSNHFNPTVAFSMSPKMVLGCREEMDSIAIELGISEKSSVRKRQLKTIKGILEESGVDFWRTGTGENNVYVPTKPDASKPMRGGELSPGVPIQIRQPVEVK